MANMAYETKKNIHSTIPQIKKPKRHNHMLITKIAHKQKPNRKFKSKKMFCFQTKKYASQSKHT